MRVTAETQMELKSTRWLLWTVVFSVVLIVVYVGSAVVSLTGLIEAVRAADGAAVLARTDIQLVRHSLVGQIVGAYLAPSRAKAPRKTDGTAFGEYIRRDRS